MTSTRSLWLAGGLVVGLVIGLNVAGVWPQIPVHAVATHGQDNFAIATGPLDDNVEAIFVLDSVTGERITQRADALEISDGRSDHRYPYRV